MLGLYAAGRAIDSAGLMAHRSTLDAAAAAVYSDRTGVFVGSGGGNYENQYDFFPLFAASNAELPAFGAELANTVNPMWLLRTLPNNVLCHIGIKYGLKGANACITNHSAGGTLAVIEAMEALRNGEADRAVAVGHETPIEPQLVLYYCARRTARNGDAAAVRRAARRQPVRRRRGRAGPRDRSFGRRPQCAGVRRDPGRRVRVRSGGYHRDSRRRRWIGARNSAGAR